MNYHPFLPAILQVLACFFATGAFWLIYVSAKDKKNKDCPVSMGRIGFALWYFGSVFISAFIGSLIFESPIFKTTALSGNPVMPSAAWAACMVGPLALRLRDIGKNPWWTLILMLGPLSLLICFVLIFIRGKPTSLSLKPSPFTKPPDSPSNKHMIPTPHKVAFVTLHGYALCIPEAESIDRKPGYGAIRHATNYTLLLINQTQSKCDAEVRIDGKHVGTWRLLPLTENTIERPVDDTGRFTFYRLGTKAAAAAQLEDNEEIGLITVVFRPEVAPRPTRRDYSLPAAPSPALYAAPAAPMRGGTGLSGKSHQSFDDAEVIDLDYGREVTLHLRLIPAAIDEPRPLLGRSSPIPPRL